MKFIKRKKSETPKVVFCPLCGSIEEMKVLTRGYGSWEELLDSVKTDYVKQMRGNTTAYSCFASGPDEDKTVARDIWTGWRDVVPVYMTTKYLGMLTCEKKTMVGVATENVDSTRFVPGSEESTTKKGDVFNYHTWYAIVGPAGYVSNVRTVVNAMDAVNGRGPMVETSFTSVPVFRLGMRERFLMFRFERSAREVMMSSEKADSLNVVKIEVNDDGLCNVIGTTPATAHLF